MKAIITILTLLAAQVEALPVMSRAKKALDDNSDREMALNPKGLNRDKKVDSLFNDELNGVSKNITVKSIFITPSFIQDMSPCPTGFKIDENRSCIEIVKVNKGNEVLIAC